MPIIFFHACQHGRLLTSNQFTIFLTRHGSVMIQARAARLLLSKNELLHGSALSALLPRATLVRPCEPME
jgi:hypothetical protein